MFLPSPKILSQLFWHRTFLGIASSNSKFDMTTAIANLSWMAATMLHHPTKGWPLPQELTMERTMLAPSTPFCKGRTSGGWKPLSITYVGCRGWYMMILCCWVRADFLNQPLQHCGMEVGMARISQIHRIPFIRPPNTINETLQYLVLGWKWPPAFPETTGVCIPAPSMYGIFIYI